VDQDPVGVENADVVDLKTKTRSALRTPTWWIQEPGAAVPPGDAQGLACRRDRRRGERP